MDAIAVVVGVIILFVGMAVGARPAINAIWPPEEPREFCYRIDDNGDCAIYPSDLVDGQVPPHLSD